MLELPESCPGVGLGDQRAGVLCSLDTCLVLLLFFFSRKKKLTFHMNCLPREMSTLFSFRMWSAVDVTGSLTLALLTF